MRLKRRGLRCTAGRVRLLTLLSASERHLSPAEACEELARSGHAVNTTTVYRALDALTAVGLIHAVHGPGPARYGITGEPHHHTVCRECGSVAGLSSRHLTEAVGRIQELRGLRPNPDGVLLIYGRCTHCST
ncbi:transcriptional repressor [Streptomyces sp. TG1A-8]|uniref:Fur family transcriptional regulator n=1 Tax=Streptomyces sp. TG1A-8 TaxID=3051385 RepID=UPI00265C5271|nr:transcriptional repressor [Streptomyces sp. TG1A-8]MDO0923926.1 transcriptional repressor [Streptomyces sp. TG1A-8]MDO0923963.1 transcriptional repressor [Streptomyces sp. TG1A-8]